jgi:hypothetical protein
MCILVVLSMFVCGGLSAPARAAGTTYYVDCAAGNDSNDGRSTGTAWRTTTRANQQTYGPGDQILFKRGTTCSGAGFKPTGNGAVGNPVTIADYGSGALPIIDGVGAHEPAILLFNVQNYTVRNLDLTQHGQTPQNITDEGKDQDQQSDEYMRAVVHILGLGPVDQQQCGESCTVRNVRLENLKVHDGQWNGIYASGGYYQLDTKTYGYVDNLVVTNVESWNNHKSGIDVTCTYYKTPIYATTNVQVLNSYLHDNGGDGFMGGPLEHGLIDGTHAAYNGKLRDARLGLWFWDSHDTIIQFSESDHNMTPQNDGGARDGGGYDMDLGSEDSVIQYSWTHDNEGEGFLLMTWPIGFGYQRGTSHNEHLRYNVSERDAKKLACPITVFGAVLPAIMFNNTIYYEPDRDASSVMYQAEGGAVCFTSWGKSGNPTVHMYNNIFINDGTVNPSAVSNNVRSETSGTFTFDNNLYWRVEGGVRFYWNRTTITSWSGWQAEGFDAHGLNADPQVVGPLGGGPSAYHLQASSPAIDAGREVTVGLRGMGSRDYFGAAIPQGTTYDVGAAEYPSGGPEPTDTPTPEGPTPTPTATPTPTVTPTPGGSTAMHVADIYTTDSAGNPKGTFTRGETVYWRVKIVDQNNSPVSGATVNCELRKPNGGVWTTKTATTGADGWALLSMNTVKNNATGTYTINVIGVSKSGATYDPGANVKSSTTFVLQ